MTLAPPAQSPELRRARELEREILQGCQTIRATWVDLAAKLYELHRDELWRLLGCESFAEFVERPGIELSPSHARSLVRTHRELVVEQGVAPKALARCDQVKVKYVLNAVRNEEVPLEEALDDCRELSREAVAEKYKSQEQGHQYDVCPMCGAKRRKAPAAA